MLTYPDRLEVLSLACVFIFFPSVCVCTGLIEHQLLVDAISTEILCAGPFISEWLSLFYLAFLQDEIPSECPNMDVCCLLITFANGLDPDLN